MLGRNQLVNLGQNSRKFPLFLLVFFNGVKDKFQNLWRAFFHIAFLYVHRSPPRKNFYFEKLKFFLAA